MGIPVYLKEILSASLHKMDREEKAYVVKMPPYTFIQVSLLET